MKLQRYGIIAGLALTSALALSACGSDNASTAAAGTTASKDCVTGTISASGSTAQKSAMTAWTTAYGQKCQGNITYDAQGSGQGVKDFIAGKVAFAGSDSALKDDEQPKADERCKSGTANDLPMVASPIAIIVNLKGVDKVTLTPELLAKIFGGKITTWNDAAIAKANTGVTLPSTTITTVHRSKDSGTTDNFAKFLTATDPTDWTFGTGKAWKAPGGQGAPDSAGVVSAVKGTDGAISYVDGPDAKKNSLTPAAIDFGAGPVEISDATVGKAVEGAKRTGTGNNIKLKLDYTIKDAAAYPLVLVTYEIVCEKGLDAGQVKLTKAFLAYTASDEGQAKLTDLGYSKLPSSLITDVRKAVDAIG